MKHVFQRLIFPLIVLCAGGTFANLSQAQVNVNIGVFAPPPPVVVAAPPVMAVVPASPYVYYAPDITVGLYFYHGYWWRPNKGHWFRARSYRGPWRYIDNHHMPTPILRLPPDHRDIPPGHFRMSHREMKKNWRHWEREGHWERVSHGHHISTAPRSRPTRHNGGPPGEISGHHQKGR
jgi:hypothetical protein